METGLHKANMFLKGSLCCKTLGIDVSALRAGSVNRGRRGGPRLGGWFWCHMVAVIKHCDSLQPTLLSDPDSSLSDSEESVFSGLEDSGSDTSEEDSEGVAGAGCDEDNGRAEETSEEQAQVGEGQTSMVLLCMKMARKEVPALGAAQHCPLHGVLRNLVL